MINTSLHTFLRINFPYAIQMDEHGRWFAINRQYKPLGWNTVETIPYENYPIATKYNGLTERFLTQLGNVERDDSGKITRVFLYDDATNPHNGSVHWDNYSEKLKMLSKIKVSKKYLKNRGRVCDTTSQEEIVFQINVKGESGTTPQE